LLIKESKTVNLTPLQIESEDSEEISDEEINSTQPSENKIKISVRLPNGNQIKFNVDPVLNFFFLTQKNYKVEKLLVGLSNQLNIEKKELKLKFDGQILNPNDKMDSFEDDDLIDLITNVEIENPLTLIFRFNHDLTEIKMKVVNSDSFKKIIEKLLKEKKVDKIVLKFDGVVLKPNQTIKEMDFENEDLIDVNVV
jgi:hypothetical protein